jgi:hypothetical protein
MSGLHEVHFAEKGTRGAHRSWEDDDARSPGGLRLWHGLPIFLWWLIIPVGLLALLAIVQSTHFWITTERRSPALSATMQEATARAQAREAEQREFRRQELQTLETIADELRRVREVLEAR